MAIFKKKGKDNGEIDFHEAIRNKKVPILTLDERWHRLFPEAKKTATIRHLEKEVNALLKEQGKVIQDIKEMKKLKKKLMMDIVENMDGQQADNEELRMKKQDKSSQLVQNINEKVSNADDKLAQLPYEIKRVNEQLLIESMKICYHDLKYSRDTSEKLGAWILATREELKKRIIQKQELDDASNEIYAYMHNMLGGEVLDIFDKKSSVLEEEE